MIIEIIPGVWGIEGDSHHVPWIRSAGKLGHDQNALPIILKYIPEGGVVVDAGAFIGTHCGPYLEKVGPTGQVLAFEPNDEAYQCLFTNCPEAVCCHAALSDHIGGGMLIQAPDTNYGACCVVPCDGIGTVQLLTLDSLVLKRLSVLKFDLEGGEYNALIGARETIARLKPVLVAEVNSSALATFGKTPSDLLNLIRELGYATVRNIYKNQEMEGPQFDVLCEFD